ncbi:MAG: S8 family serine peptidase [Sedimentisphaerales bacterium]
MKNIFDRNLRRRAFAKGGDALCLRRFPALTSIFAVLVCILADVTADQKGAITNLKDSNVRQNVVERLAGESRQKKAKAWEIASRDGWTPKKKVNNTTSELMAIEGDRVYVYKTCNVNAAISIAANLIRNTAPYYLNGAGLTVGIWDAGNVRATHQEFGGRVTIRDNVGSEDHSTHVAGTIAAAGVVANAMGMAPSVLIDSYDWTDDISEMTSRAMSYPNEPDKIQVSNHSYGYVAGWDNSSSPPRWYGTWGYGYRESDYFGQYDTEVAQWDELCYNAPYYLPFNAVGNDREDNAPAAGQQFQYWKSRWRTKTYDPSTDPYNDDWDNGGFDTIIIPGTAKNNMTVGAVNDAVTGGVRDLTKGTMTAFSGWGPTDDGRIKPDIVTNGTTLYSPIASSNSSYATYSGTSMAAPGAAGTAILLVDYYDRLFPAQAMRSSTIKALMIHTADDLGNPGPDYKFGWGLINAEAAAKQIKDHYDAPDANKIVEGLLDSAHTVRTYTFEFGTAGPVKATLCWTDPPAAAADGLDNRSPRLVNDLDLRIIDPTGSVTYYPFVLDLNSPAAPATTGDNTRDNVEQVIISSPSIPGTYTVRISHKASLTNGQQYYSLIVSGYSPLADFHGDGFVDFEDLEMLLDYWLQDEPLVDIAPSGGDGIINLLDFAKFAQYWP